MNSTIKFIFLGAICFATQAFPMQSVALADLRSQAAQQVSALVRRGKEVVIDASPSVKIAAGVAIGAAATVYAVVQLRKKAEYGALEARFKQGLPAAAQDDARNSDPERQAFISPDQFVYLLVDAAEVQGSRAYEILLSRNMIIVKTAYMNGVQQSFFKNKIAEEERRALQQEGLYTGPDEVFMGYLEKFSREITEKKHS